ncbi:MAG: glycerol-3-phosphate acyltransferase [Chloroflexi bacterium]|nr:glycerol-3-phosphate acyltransferase [Chloroflexota bacterium]
MAWELILLFIGAYLLGSVQFATILVSRKGVDLHSFGSGNPGASNVLASTKNVKMAAVVFLLDSLKGVVPVLITKSLGFNIDLQIWVALCAVIGHDFPIFFGFKGGRGILTSMGGILAANIWSGLTLLFIVFAVFTPIFKNQPLGVFVAFLTLPFLPLIFGYTDAGFAVSLPLILIGLLGFSRRLFVKRRQISQYTPLNELFINRLLFDRDIKDRVSWTNATKNEIKTG